MTLLDAMNALYAKYSYYQNGLLTQAFEGQAGMEAMGRLMDGLRAKAPERIGDDPVIGTASYDNGGVLEFRTRGGGKVMVRPSGTEPKVKLYLSVKADSRAAARRNAPPWRSCCGTRRWS